MNRKLLLMFLVIIILFVSAAPVWALDYGNVICENYELSYMSPDAWAWNGTYGWSYIQSSQYIWYEHLNSVYMWNDYYGARRYVYEAGWTWWATNGVKEIGPRNFAMWVEDYVYRDTLPVRPGNYPSEHLNINLGSPTPGQSHSYHVFLETRTNPWKIQWYIDGQWKNIDRVAQVSFGRSRAGSERAHPFDNNWGHWSGLRRNYGPTVTAPWSTFVVAEDTDPIDANPPGAGGYYAQAVNTTEFYVWPH